MTTQEAINELRDNFENYPIISITVYRSHISITLKNRRLVGFQTGIEIIEWMENNYLK